MTSPAQPSGVRTSGAPAAWTRLDERLAAKRQVDQLRPHPLRPRVFAPLTANALASAVRAARG